MSLDLDPRQRAMLQEMGVRVWQPVVEQAAPAPAEVVNAAQQATARAIEKMAVNAVGTVTDKLPVKPSAPVRETGALDWPALAQAVQDCQACRLCAGRRAPVFGSADAAPGPADWMVVGEPPEEAEERAGTPFVGPAGQLLDNMLRAVGVSRQASDAGHACAAAQTAYLSNVVKCRPALMRNPAPQDLAACEAFLRREVALVQPKVILAMGRFAAQSLLRESLPEVATIPMGKLRGQVHRYRGVPVIVTYNPVYLLRTQQDKARAWTDLCLATAQLGYVRPRGG
jgi:uracil-DNA glycosylase